VLPVPKPRDTHLSEHELFISGRTQRRTSAKKEVSRIKEEEKKKHLEEKKAREAKENKESEAQGKGKSKGPESKDTESKETEAKVEPVKCFGIEEMPNFAEGKEIEKTFLQEPCIWDFDQITYELQVCLHIVLLAES
jgi:hypothetical protein